jgi:hypothetical protein
MLYFANFSDIHFMFDEERFLREFDLGEIQKVVLYAMMALGIKCVVLRAQLLIHVVAPCRYSNSSIFNHISRSHRGEPLFKEARNALKENFDHQSPTTIQVYTLLSTYHLTFGGARKAWLYLGRSLAEPISGMSWLILTRNGQQLGQES